MKKLFVLLLMSFICTTAAFAKDLRFIQITDVRYSKQNNSDVLKNVIKDVNKQKNVDFVVFTGDNIERPDVNILKDFLLEAKKLHKPFYVIIGDKDVNKHKNLSKNEYQAILKKKLPNCKTKDLNYVFERNGVVFLVVDGAKDVIPGTNGYYKDDVVSWVDTNLNLYSKKNVIILQHFPLIPPENNEGYITFKPQKYLDVIQRHNNVKAVVTGHFGVNKEETVNGIIHITTAPAPNYRIIDIIDCTSANPSVWAEVINVE